MESGSSAPTSPVIPDLSQMNASEAFTLLMSDNDPPELTASATCEWWNADDKLAAYQLFAPSWCDAVRHHSCIHSYSAQPNAATPEGFSTMYLHSTKQTMQRLFVEGNLKSRYLFSSAMQCCLHQVAHDHFELSNSKIADDSIILQMNIKDDFVASEGREAINGYV
eukprot:3475300-Amphidinium_carterae.1